MRSELFVGNIVAVVCARARSPLQHRYYLPGNHRDMYNIIVKSGRLENTWSYILLFNLATVF
jgi:hypothetical protein